MKKKEKNKISKKNSTRQKKEKVRNTSKNNHKTTLRTGAMKWEKSSKEEEEHDN